MTSAACKPHVNAPESVGAKSLICGYSSMVEPQPSKLRRSERFQAHSCKPTGSEPLLGLGRADARKREDVIGIQKERA
jgi:hypothetical protein